MGMNVVTQNKYMFMIHDIIHDVPKLRARRIHSRNLIALSTCSHLYTGSRLRICSHIDIYGSHLHICSNHRYYLYAQTYMRKDTTIKACVAT